MSTRATLAVLLLSVLPAAACALGPSAVAPATGPVRPTVAGRSPATFPGRDAARLAFTRESGTLRATLEDAAWLRFEGPPEVVEARHRAYFELGYTTFRVELRTKELAQPTAETFLLEDSRGAQIVGRPIAYEGSSQQVDDRFFTAFALSFRHMITRDLAWIRLTRQVDGSSVEWTFGGGGG